MVVDKLNDALSVGDATAASALFSYNAIFEDPTLRTRVEGQIAIEAYLQRVVHSLPYGVGNNISHILCNAGGGGCEWRPSGSAVRYGVAALELNRSGNITRFTATWYGSPGQQDGDESVGCTGPYAVGRSCHEIESQELEQTVSTI